MFQPNLLEIICLGCKYKHNANDTEMLVTVFAVGCGVFRTENQLFACVLVTSC